ncbi:MAG TPA: ATP-binding cassette domain-containing protein [Ignavibacteriaceae bacterium]|nr:ATP-binding cassette domain-containing protein [Ignavibacteriaceae bacterium]
MDPFLLQVKNLSKYYSRHGLEKLPVLESINFSIEESKNGRIISILAPFRTGKTTLLKIISALEMPSEGEVLLFGRKYENPDGEIAYLPEKPSHFPWLNVEENIKLISQIKDEKLPFETVKKIISLIGLTGYEDFIPHNKSYGFRFRAALGRALAANPKIILLDDVFKNIDTESRDELYMMLNEIKNELKLTFILTTTNVTESILLSDQIFLMYGKPGKMLMEIDPDKLKKASGNVKTEEFTSIRKEIETAYQVENFGSSINISI